MGQRHKKHRVQQYELEQRKKGWGFLNTEVVPVSPLSNNTSDPDDPSNKPLRHSKVSAAAKLISSNKIHSPFFTACARVP